MKMFMIRAKRNLKGSIHDMLAHALLKIPVSC